MRGWAVFLVGIWMLSQFSVFEHYRAEDALAAWAYPDTVTYSDDRIVYKLATVTETTTVNDSVQYRVYPDLTDMASDMLAEILWKSNGDSVMAVTGDTGDMSAMDSATATAVAAAWGVRDPHTVELAWHDGGAGDSTLAALGVTPAESTQLAALAGFDYKATPYTPSYFTLARYNDSLTLVGDSLWNAKADPIWSNEMYYDRAMIEYLYFWRTGDTSRLVRADSYVVDYRDEYVLPNTLTEYACPTGKWHFPEGLAAHWVLREDTLSRNAVAHMARCHGGPGKSWMNRAMDTTFLYIDGRAQGRALLDVTVAALLDLPGRNYDGTDSTFNWDSLATAGIDSLIQIYARPQAGSGPTEGIWYLRSYCYSQPAFQVTHALLYSFARYIDLIDDGTFADTVESIMAASLDTILTYRREYDGEPVIQYANLLVGKPDGVDTTCAAPAYQGLQFNGDGIPDDTTNFGGLDLNGLIVGALGWAFDQYGDSTYWYMADSLMGAMLDVTGWYAGSGKAYNQSFWQSQRALYWLNGGP